MVCCSELALHMRAHNQIRQVSAMGMVMRTSAARETRGTSAARAGRGTSAARTGATMGHPRMLNLLTKMTLVLINLTFGCNSS